MSTLPTKAKIVIIGGGIFSNCSIIEAINYIELKTKNKIKLNYIKRNRVGDHIWYISNLSKFKKDYPKWRVSYNTDLIIDEIVDIYK